jgi:DNA-binding response OmpR family regulator
MAIVLVVDDSLLARHTVRLALRAHHEVLEASDGIAGLLIARACMPDVLIAAEHLPATSGRSLLAMLSREGHATPGILIRSPVPHDAPPQAEDGMLTLMRPLCTKMIRAAVDRALDRRSAHASSRSAAA